MLVLLKRNLRQVLEAVLRIPQNFFKILHVLFYYIWKWFSEISSICIIGKEAHNAQPFVRAPWIIMLGTICIYGILKFTSYINIPFLCVSMWACTENWTRVTNSSIWTMKVKHTYYSVTRVVCDFLCFFLSGASAKNGHSHFIQHLHYILLIYEFCEYEKLCVRPT